jgi:phosphate transport system permease protein
MKSHPAPRPGAAERQPLFPFLRNRQAKGGRRRFEHVIVLALLLSGLITLLTTAGIIAVLAGETWNFFQHVSIWEFFGSKDWAPLFNPPRYGVLPLLGGTAMVTAGAAIISLTFGLMTAIFLAEYAPEKLRRVLKPILEILAGVPTVVYGYFALTLITPLLQRWFPQTEVFNVASAAFAMGVMILPMVASMSEDAMLAVPASLRHGAYALGATRLEVSLKVVLPASISGITAAFILAISRAIGETMIVTIAAGGTPRLTWNPLEGMQTMTAYIAAVSQGDTPHGSVGYMTIFAVGSALFVMTLGLNILARWVSRRFREVYQ